MLSLARNEPVPEPAGRATVAASASKRAIDADVKTELEEVGLSTQAGWHASFVLFTTGGLLVVAIGLLWPASYPVGITILGAISIALGLLSLAGARFVPTSDLFTHLRLFAGLSIYLAGAIMAGDERLAFAMLPIMTLLTPAYLYGARFAIPYATYVTGFAGAMIYLSDGPARLAHAILTGEALLMVAGAFMVSKGHTRALARRNRKLAYTDPLTGVANTRQLRERLTAELESLEQGGPAFALFALDLDNFKLVNDRFDHSTGDRVLKAVAAEIETQLQPEQLLARRGGDEFTVLVPLAGDPDLNRLMVAIADAVRRARSAACPEVTPSGSVAYVTARAGDTVSSILQRADDELHEAKSRFHLLNGPSRPAGIPGLESVAFDASASVLHDHADGTDAEHTLGGRLREVLRFGSGNPIWALSSTIFVQFGAILAITSGTGMLRPLGPVTGCLLALGLVSLSGLSLVAARLRLPLRLLSVSFLTALALIATGVWLAGPSGSAMIDLFAALAMYGFFYFAPRVALLHMILAMTAYGVFAVGSDYPVGALRTAITVPTVIIASGLIMKMRSVTVGFARTNRELSEIDALTGVANVRALSLRTGDVIAKATAHGGRPAMIALDLDQFKAVNDTYSHTVGDQVLEAVARAIVDTVRSDDFVARRGGDEFFILCESADDAQIEQMVGRLTQAIAHARSRICPDVTPTASIGAVPWQAGEDAPSFIQNADAALHDVKVRTRARGYAQIA